MKRPAIALALALVAVATASASPQRSVNAIAAARASAAAREARLVLRRIVVPRSATRVGRVPRGSTRYLPVITPWDKFVRRTGYWRVPGTLRSVTNFIRAADEPFVSVPSDTGVAGYREFNADVGMRTFDLVVFRHKGTIFIRAQVDVTWIYPRSPKEKVPAAAREIDVTAPKVSRQVTDPADVAKIVRWFDDLPVRPPGVAGRCLPTIRGQSIALVFRAANGTRIAGASVPTRYMAWVCDAIRFTIHGHSQTPLVDRWEGHGFADRVGKLLGVALTSSGG